MQFIVISYQLKITLYALFFGAFAGAAYDLLKILRMLGGVIPVMGKRIPLLSRLPALPGHGGKLSRGVRDVILVNLLDIVYSVVLSASFCVFLFASNNGRFRWYLLFGAALGFALYRLSIGRAVMLLSGWIVSAVRSIFGFLLFALSRPFVLIGKGLKKLFAPLGGFILRRKCAIITERERKRLPETVRFR